MGLDFYLSIEAEYLQSFKNRSHCINYRILHAKTSESSNPLGSKDAGQQITDCSKVEGAAWGYGNRATV